MGGKLRRELLAAEDQGLCLVAGGDELTLEFEVSGLPPLAPGQVRDYFLRTVGWDKDADYHVAEGTTLEPLPWRGMDDQAARIPDLARDLNVSGETIRRDLDYLHSKGLVRRHFGGAMVNPVGVEPTWSERLTSLADQKLDIARAAFELLSEGEVVMLGAGSTIFVLAKRLFSENWRGTVFTNSIAAATNFLASSRARVVLVSNEIGSGVVPPTASGRRFRFG